MPVDVSEPLLNVETSQRIQPKAVSGEESANSVISKMADNTLSLWWDTTPLRNSAVGKAAEKVEKNLKAEVAFKNKDSKTDHRISFKVLAMQALAKIEYKGWVNAAVNYDARAATTEAEVSEQISQKQDLVISHAITRTENKSQVAWRWNW
ncbi:MAG: hypothetical protein A2622_06845 [Bdellovibrionales bacterium RIFCSPHIGHO2_01_FULL_40_29]|nr:MAG: hypothetical protein A2622_06845 [Bdellovibrionales bacterium RIFCSPHIGHO2_01_FULL_40_29]OFZ35157.1 MAG: hypothetical protein A3D17_07195 [Bdellovibrionales bacterium RIFCSPHIGHO2_02_FULL_40_15]